MKHRRLYEPQRALAKLSLVAGFHGFNMEICSIVLDYGVFSSRRSKIVAFFACCAITGRELEWSISTWLIIM
jgi:hypothetical protein